MRCWQEHGAVVSWAKCGGGNVARRFLEHDHAAGAESLLHNCCARRNPQSNFCEAKVRSTTTHQRRKQRLLKLLTVTASSSGLVLRELLREDPSSEGFRDTLLFTRRV